MAHQEKIDYLLINLRELEKLIAGMRDMEIYPASFFSQCFSLSRQLMNELHSLETEQIEELARQMEEHRQLIESIPPRQIEAPAATPVPPIAPAPPVSPSPEPLAHRQTEQPVGAYTPPEPLTLRPASEPETVVPVAAVSSPADEPLGEEPIRRKQDTPPPPPPATIGEKPTISLNEVLEKKNLSDFRKAFSLNDRFRFRRELFGGDEEKMNRAIRDLNELTTYEDSIGYLHHQLQWNVDDAAVADFILLLEKRFS